MLDLVKDSYTYQFEHVDCGLMQVDEAITTRPPQTAFIPMADSFN